MIRKLEFEYFAMNGELFHSSDLVLGALEYTHMHTHDFYEFFVVLSGSFIHDCNGKKVVLYKQQGQFVCPQDYHCFLTDSKSGINRLRNIAIQKNYLDALLREANVGIELQMLQSFTYDIVSFEQYQRKSGYLSREEKLNSKSMVVLNSILSDLYFEQLVAENKNEVPYWLRNSCTMFEELDTNLCDIKEFVRISGKTQEHLTREMKRYYECTLSEYVNRVRINRAKEMLRADSKKISDIAFDCGFHNIAYFNRSFKLSQGITPKEYREKQKNMF